MQPHTATIGTLLGALLLARSPHIPHAEAHVHRHEAHVHRHEAHVHRHEAHVHRHSRWHAKRVQAPTSHHGSPHQPWPTSHGPPAMAHQPPWVAPPAMAHQPPKATSRARSLPLRYSVTVGPDRCQRCYGGCHAWPKPEGSRRGILRLHSVTLRMPVDTRRRWRQGAPRRRRCC